MKTTVTLNDFRDAFHKMGRKENFSYEGLKALFEYIERFEEELGEELELDVIALCCDYTEYENIEAFHADYDEEEYPFMEDIESATHVIPIDDEAFIIQQF